jgi:hypothetical protein
MAAIKTKTNLYEIKSLNSNNPQCCCNHMQTYQMPCRHIFKCRADLSLSLIEADMIKDFRHDSLLNVIDVDVDVDGSETIKQISNLNKHKKQNNLSVKDKYNLAWNSFKELVSALSVLKDEDYKYED